VPPGAPIAPGTGVPVAPETELVVGAEGAPQVGGLPVAPIDGQQMGAQIAQLFTDLFQSIGNPMMRHGPRTLSDIQIVLSDEEIKKLPMGLYHNIKTESSDNTCSICMDEFLDDDFVRKVPCEHIFHRPCIDKWLLTENVKCPVCRMECGKGAPLM